MNLDKNEQARVQLEKHGDQKLVNLNKEAGVVLEKAGLKNVTARVVMVLDASGSETHQFDHGDTQEVVNRLAVLALNLDDNGELEAWAYADTHKKLPVITLNSLPDYIKSIRKSSGGWLASLFGGGGGSGIVPGLGSSNNEPPCMEAILADCKDTKDMPTLVIFVTDGGIDKGRAIKEVLIKASHYPIFWQFVGIGGSSYGVLEDFDNMKGRYVDNANFFALDDYKSVSDQELYRRLMAEFPSWLQKVKQMGMLPR